MGLTALKAGVLPEPRAFGEGRVLLVSEFLVVFLALAGRAQCLDLLGAPRVQVKVRLFAEESGQRPIIRVE